MAAERVHTATGSSHVAQQKLNHRGGSDDLRSEGMLRPADSVDDRRDFFHVAVFADGRKQFNSLQVLFLGDTGDALDGFRGVPRILLLHQLKDAARMLKRQIIGDIWRKTWR